MYNITTLEFCGKKIKKKEYDTELNLSTSLPIIHPSPLPCMLLLILLKIPAFTLLIYHLLVDLEILLYVETRKINVLRSTLSHLGEKIRVHATQETASNRARLPTTTSCRG